MEKTKIFTPISIFAIAVMAVFLAVGFIFADTWQAPPGSPPDPNAAAPINVSEKAQTKFGALTIGGTNWTQFQMLPSIDDVFNPATGGNDRAHFHFNFPSVPSGKTPLLEIPADVWIISTNHNLRVDGNLYLTGNNDSTLDFGWGTKLQRRSSDGNLLISSQTGIVDINGTTRTDYLTIRPQSNSAGEGGEIQLQGASGLTTWQMDTLNGWLRFHHDGAIPFEVTNDNKVCINGDCRSGWPSSSSSINYGTCYWITWFENSAGSRQECPVGYVMTGQFAGYGGFGPHQQSWGTKCCQLN